ncbi:hypothetical protein F7725_022045 [Dissostichus mawsoni]|uniref:Uncharacterized protein n=1 Tax=Dissostichus mawsoni TaxID=36200 RepID=A0A7J5ZDE4_DISMA|nr:hypothetical protein F7725_022045 [Dissostichus mawsoni]
MLAKCSSFTFPVSPPPGPPCSCCLGSCCLGGSSSTPSSVRTHRFFFQSCSKPSLLFSSRPSFNTTFMPFSSIFLPKLKAPSSRFL